MDGDFCEEKQTNKNINLVCNHIPYIVLGGRVTQATGQPHGWCLAPQDTTSLVLSSFLSPGWDASP